MDGSDVGVEVEKYKKHIAKNVRVLPRVAGEIVPDLEHTILFPLSIGSWHDYDATELLIARREGTCWVVFAALTE